MVLRGVDRDRGLFRLQTDRRSAKVAAIAACPAVALLFWDPRRAVQLRVAGGARVLTGGSAPPAAWTTAWAAVPVAARAAYRTAAPPGSALARAGPAPEDGDGAANFAVIELAAESLDLLWLGPDGHRRAGWTRGGDGWAGGWRVP